MKKTTVTMVFAISMWCAPNSFAEGNPDAEWAEKAALQYEQEAAAADAKGDVESAAIYRRMAQIKRDAGAAAREGKEMDWTEYHALSEKLQKASEAKCGKGEHDQGAKEKHVKDKKAKDKYANGKEDPGQGFMDAAAEYEQLGKKAIQEADAVKAQIYLELAEIKRKAAQAARDGKDFNWDRYHELKGKLP